MSLCYSLLVPVIVFIRAFLRTIEEIVTTVCDWVTTTLRRMVETCDEFCDWGIFSFLCSWVCRLIEVVETVTDWVCTEVIERIIRWIQIIVEYIIYIVKWICWIIDWGLRLPELLLCAATIRPRKTMRVCVKILTDAAGTPAVPIATVATWMGDARTIFANCNINMRVVSTDLVENTNFLTGTTCDFGGMFSDFFVWFTENAEPTCVTVYIVQDITGASGCAYPGSDWVTVDAGGTGCVVAQEIGHLADLWAHSDTAGNIMANPCGNNITAFQCCMIRSSRFAVSEIQRVVTGVTRI